MGYWFTTYPTDDEVANPLYLALDDIGKAVTTFEMDVFACHVALEMISSVSGIPVRELYDGTERGKIRSDAAPEAHDHAFNDALCFCEFFLNRITPLSDKMIKDILVHTRFTLSYVLSVDPTDPEHSLTIKGKTRNLAMFRLTDNNNNDLRHISHIEYDTRIICKRFGSGEYSCSQIVGAMDMGDTCSEYYDTILGDLVGRTGRITVDTGDATAILGYDDGRVPLVQLISELERRCSRIEPLCYHISRDVSDMSNGRVCEDESMLANVRVRDSNMESSPIGIDEACKNNPAIVEEAIWFIRLLNCILSTSKSDNHVLDLKFHIESLMRLLDPDLFGRRYAAPDMTFVECEKLRDRYIMSLGFDSLDGFCRISGVSDQESTTWDSFERDWKYSSRQGGPVRDERLVCVIGKPGSATIGDFEPWKAVDRPLVVNRPPRGRGHGPTTILVTDRTHRFDLVSRLGSPANREMCQNIRMLVVVTGDEGTMVMRNRDSNEIPEIVVNDIEELFNIHTEYVIPRMRIAASDIMSSMREPENEFEERVFATMRWFCERAEQTVDRFRRIRRRIPGTR